jgi:hypothetical protein
MNLYGTVFASVVVATVFFIVIEDTSWERKMDKNNREMGRSK